MAEELKLYCIVSNEAAALCNGVRGKMAAQAGHAFVGALLDSLLRFNERAIHYINAPSSPKIVLATNQDGVEQLATLYKPTHGVALIKDAGRTVFKEPTITAVGIGPIFPSEQEAILAGLRPWT